jgi:hypothetical protein
MLFKTKHILLISVSDYYFFVIIIINANINFIIARNKNLQTGLVFDSSLILLKYYIKTRHL